ncbi:nitrogen regulation protein NR(II) [Basilea psittacipulmonis]|uniref:Sensory histidine kinase/phosphatase NtrB n=2 Tax=Basilea TaxID=1472344 RepID=A0A077DH03_9BURK|nr:nitrogen regulation protein NR(II) [Basilea psittacipulmonis]AIL32712.1 hypothetical protein IX83_04775 [Basilea psittacipulmonis DSM 24701]
MQDDLTNSLMTAVLCLDEQGEIVYANNAAENIFMRSKKYLYGHRLDAFILQDRESTDSYQLAWARLQHPQECMVTFYASIFQDVLSFHIPVVCTIQKLEQADFSYMVEIRNLAAFETNHQQSSQQVTIYQEVLRNLAHEIKNPLGGIKGAAQLLALELENSDYVEYTQVITQEVDRLQSLVDQLGRSFQHPLNKIKLNIHEVCERVISLIHAQYRDEIRLLKDYDASIPLVQADFDKFVQVVLNLVQNAAQSCMQKRQEKSDYQPEILIKTRVNVSEIMPGQSSGKMMCISVIDNGVGVSASVKDKLFHPLVTTKPTGTGLGLSLAQELMHLHGGFIDFDSNALKTEFRIFLPLEVNK